MKLMGISPLYLALLAVAIAVLGTGISLITMQPGTKEQVQDLEILTQRMDSEIERLKSQNVRLTQALNRLSSELERVKIEQGTQKQELENQEMEFRNHLGLIYGAFQPYYSASAYTHEQIKSDITSIQYRLELIRQRLGIYSWW